ncbi:MAG: tetratricopeptide repeat protein [Candidatus Hodarchaeales archaeon]
MSDSAQNGLIKIEQLIYEGNFNNAFQLIAILTKRKDLTFPEQFSLNLLSSALLIKQGLFSKSLTLVEHSLLKFKSLEYAVQTIEAFIIMADALRNLGKLDEGLNAVTKGEELCRSFSRESPSLDINQQEASLLYQKGSIYHKKGLLDQALEFHKQALNFRNKIQNKYQIAASLNSIGMIYDFKGEWDQALDYYQSSLVLRNEIGNKQEIAISLNNLGVVHFLKGELDHALHNYSQSLDLFQKLGSKQYVAGSLANLGIIHRIKGNLDQALDYYQQSLVIAEEIGNQQEIARLLTNMGIVFHDKGDWTRGMEYFQQSLDIRIDIGNDDETSHTLSQLISLIVTIVSFGKKSLFKESNAIKGLSNYLSQLEAIHKKTKNSLIDQRFRLATALVLNISEVKEEKDKARKIFNKLIQEEKLEYEQKIFISIALSHSIFENYILTGNQNILRDLGNQIDTILALTKEKQLHMIFLTILLLKGKLEVLHLNLEKANSLFQQVKMESQNKGYKLLSQQCDDEFAKLQTYAAIGTVLETQKEEEKHFRKQQVDEIFEYLKRTAIQLITIDK